MDRLKKYPTAVEFFITRKITSASVTFYQAVSNQK